MPRHYRRTEAVQEVELDEVDLADDQAFNLVDEYLHREHPALLDSQVGCGAVLSPACYRDRLACD